MLRQILKQIADYKRVNNNKCPLYIYINKKQYKRLKKELSITENITEDIKKLYFIDFRIKEE